MIEYFKLKNFLSYRDETELSFLASKKNGGTESSPSTWYKEIDGKLILRLLIGVGLNGSGKSKILEGLEYLCDLATIKPDKPTIRPDYKPFLLDDESRNMPTEMTLSFYIDNINYLYYLKVSKVRIEEEELKVQVSNRSQKVYSRFFDPDKDTVKVNFGAVCDLKKEDQRDLEKNTLQNASVLSTFGSMNMESIALKQVYSYLNGRISIASKKEIGLADSLSSGNADNDNRMKLLLLKLLHDIGTNIVDYHVDITSIQIDNLEKDGMPDFLVEQLRKQYPSGAIEKKNLRFDHSTSKGNKSLDLSFESFGTLNIIWLLVVFYDVVLGKKCTCIDELGSGIHTKALEFILNMYLALADECQVVVATHDLRLLEIENLRRDAVRKFEKNEDGVSYIAKHEYVHKTKSLLKKYFEDLDKVTPSASDMSFEPYRVILDGSEVES